jgi:hypothetical protein
MQFVMPPPLAKATAASHQTPNIQDKIVHQVFITTNTPHCHCKPLIAATMPIHLCEYHGNLYLDMSMATKESEASRHALMKPQWLKIRARKT